jgi:asparagine synthetase B (glutamine-hydrolysing)
MHDMKDGTAPPPPLLVFQGPGDSASSTTLAPQARSAPALAADVLSARVLLRSPTRPESTIYEAIRARPTAFAPLAGASPVAVAPPKDLHEAARRLRGALEVAVGRAIGDARSVAVLTGGGLDSSGLAVLALRAALERGIRVFVVALDFASAGDDRPYLRALEAETGVKVYRVPPEEGAANRRLLDEGVDAAPFHYPTALSQLEVLRRAREEGAEVALAGIGGDELFDGSPNAPGAQLLAGDVLGAVSNARALQGFGTARFPVLSRAVRPAFARFQPRWLRARRLRAVHHAPSWAGPQMLLEAERIAARDRDLALARLTAQEEFFRRPDYEQMTAYFHQEQLASGLARRHPYLDKDLVALVTSMPPHFLIAGATRRGLFRRALADLLPPAIRDRQDKASFTPAFSRLLEALGGVQAFAPVLRDARASAALGLVHPTRFAAASQELFRDTEAGWDYGRAWAALATELFLRGHCNVSAA